MVAYVTHGLLLQVRIYIQEIESYVTSLFVEKLYVVPGYIIVFLVIGANAAFHFCWVFCLAVCQTYQISCLAMTTNERMNAGRYTHFHKSGAKSSHGHR